MTDTYQPLKSSKSLDPCDHEVFTLARQIGVVGAISLLVGGTGMIATSGQPDWDIARSLYLALVVLGPMGILIAQKFLRILMKHRRQELNIFDN
ncbi:hypothetical protein [uncultured Pelagimonas sp.]|uniref:hypothetical protein n=1 Tax=uncultured Pelagimonas sp. TaxID=1618102 RepID=UPI0026079DBD|nr:hypothetical protein [uncultured Pelagimonas sp.]